MQKQGARFHEALKPDGVLCLALASRDQWPSEVEEAYERVKVLGRPVPAELVEVAMYPHCPPLEQVRAWLE